MKSARWLFGFLAILAILTLVLQSSQDSRAEGLVFVETAPHYQECPAEESVEYGWFIYNDFNSTYLVQISLNPDSGSGWSSELSQVVIVVEPGEGTHVSLTVTAERDVESIGVN
ncbi:MAG: hypothetical protein ACUVT7_02780 [Thermoplasmata archaeon]